MKINDKMLEFQGSFYFVNRQFSCSLLSSIRPRGRNQCALWGPGQETEGLRKRAVELAFQVLWIMCFKNSKSDSGLRERTAEVWGPRLG